MIVNNEIRGNDEKKIIREKEMKFNVNWHFYSIEKVSEFGIKNSFILLLTRSIFNGFFPSST